MGIIIPLTGSVILNIFFMNAAWIYPALHAVIEGVGIFTASALVFLILLSNEHRTNPVYGVWSLCAFLGMGVLDLFHVLIGAGNNFVWLHSLAVLAGGLFLSLAWIPSRFVLPSLARGLPGLTVLIMLGTAFFSFYFPETVPLMAIDGKISVTAGLLRAATGLFFFIGMFRFMALYRSRPDWLELVMTGFCALMGVSMTFAYSRLWCPAWWWWHGLRLVSYFIITGFIMLFYQRMTEELREVKNRLEESMDTLARQAQELERSNKELDQFAYVASHDLQEPLRMVASYVQLLAKRYKGQLDTDADEFISFAVDGAKRMQDLISDLLAFSRVGTRAKEFALTDCEKVLDRALQNLQTAIVENHAEITRDSLPKVMVDDIQIVSVFQNLIVNAIKFRKKDVVPRVHISCRSEGKVSVFSVMDNGIGIAPEHYEKIFQIFHRLYPRDEYPGSGIGLSVCKKIVERHDGRIWVESRAGEGSTFHFTLPLAAS